MENKKETLPFSFYKALSATLFSLIFLLIFWAAIDVWLLAFAGILFAIFLRTLTQPLKNILRIPDGLAITIVLIFILVSTVATIAFLTPTVSQQLSNLSAEIPKAWEKLETSLDSYLQIDSLSSLYKESDLSQFFSQSKNIILQTATLFSTTFGFLGSVVVFLFIGIFLAYDPQTYRHGLIQLAPVKYHRSFDLLLKDLTVVLRWWLMGKLLSMAIVGILTTLGLWLLNVPLALTLGLFAAFLTFVPNLGPILSAIPAVLMAVVQSSELALYVVLLYLVIQTFESYLITPLIQNNTLALPPVVIILAQLVMALFTGILGLTLATPLLAVITVVIRKCYIEKRA